MSKQYIQRTEVLLTPDDFALIKKAMAAVEATEKVKCTLSHFIRQAAITKAAATLGKQVAP